ncbi:MAG: dUTP diphosphatase [Campylobacterales bacterium]|nr:dUTP diphosphatase [Campylobacterales bacterium]
MDKLRTMLKLQQQLNDATNGINWEVGTTKNGKKINWKRCIYMECAEMIDCFAWKHWKNIDAQPDYDNLQIEVVDVWHFVMSFALETYKTNKLGSIETLAEQIAQMPNFELLQEPLEAFEEEMLILITIEAVMRDALEIRASLTKLLFDFFELCRLTKLDMATLYRLYVGKNILNQFRQDHGYKEGHYVKIWNGLEDNAVMKQLWESDAQMSPEVLYAGLKRRYEAL